MKNGYWGYNIKKSKYVPFNTEPMSLFPTIVEPKKKVVYCRRCHRWEYIFGFTNNMLKTQCGMIYEGPFVVENSLINYSYKIQNQNNSYVIKVKSQKASINNRLLKEDEYILNLNKKVLYKNGKSVFEKDDISCSICNELTTEILSEMGDRYKEQFGIKPTIASQLKGFNLIIGYMLSPFNVNFYTIAHHWGLNPYDKEFTSLSSGNTPTAENEMFESLGIKPTKTIRKMHQKFPQSVICYAAAKDLGFTDVNLLQNTISSRFYAFLKYCMINFAVGYITYTVRDDLKSYVRDLLQLTTQKAVWNSIERTLDYLTTKEGRDYVVVDGIEIYSRIREYLTNEEKKEIMREGFNQYTHDFLVKRLDAYNDTVRAKRLAESNVIFNIEDKFLALEYKAGDDKKKIINSNTGKVEIVDKPDEERYCFYVAKDSNTLKKIGIAMHNCVGYCYAKSVEQRHCTIVYAVKKGYYKICIEVTPNFTIRQSLGPCNQPLSGDALEAYHEWCLEKNIVFVKAFGINESVRSFL